MSADVPRALAVAEAQFLLAECPVYLDTETTGLDRQSEIVEIAVLDHDGLALVDTLVRPLRSIPRGASRIHGITDAQVHNAPRWADVWPQVQEALRGRPVIIYNADFDLRMMQQTHRVARLVWRRSAIRPVCLMHLYARFYGQRRGDGFRWQSLAAAAQQCRIRMCNSHRAADDARLARAVLHYIARV